MPTSIACDEASVDRRRRPRRPRPAAQPAMPAWPLANARRSRRSGFSWRVSPDGRLRLGLERVERRCIRIGGKRAIRRRLDPKWTRIAVLRKSLRNVSSESDDISVRFGGIMEAAGSCPAAFVMREAALFAACRLPCSRRERPGGRSALARRGAGAARRRPRAAPPSRRRPRPGRLAVFVPAWDEAAVIGAMLAHARARLRRGRLPPLCRLLPQRSGDDRGGPRGATRPRVRLVVGPAPGPTSKADCLNRLWERMIEDEAADGSALQGGGAPRRRGRRPFGRARPVRRADRAVRPRPVAGRAADRSRTRAGSAAIMPTNSPKRTARSWSSARRSAPACPRPASAARSRATRSTALAAARGGAVRPRQPHRGL